VLGAIPSGEGLADVQVWAPNALDLDALTVERGW
jgi:hypothetical protein